MQIRVLFFASYRELLDTREISLSLPDGASVEGLVGELRGRGEPFSHLPARPAVAVNAVYADLEAALEDGDTVAFIPPVAGG